MDHLPIPEYYKHRHIQVPYLDYGIKYDFHGFDGFPARIGFNAERLRKFEWGNPVLCATKVLLREGLFRTAYALTDDAVDETEGHLWKWLKNHARRDQDLGFTPRSNLRAEEDLKRCSGDALHLFIFDEPETFSLARVLTLEDHFDAASAVRKWIHTFFQEWLYFGMLHELEKLVDVPIPWEKTKVPREDGKGLRISTSWMADYSKTLLVKELWRREVPFGVKEGDWVYVHRGWLDHFHENGTPDQGAPAPEPESLLPKGHDWGPYRVDRFEAKNNNVWLKVMDGNKGIMFPFTVSNIRHACRSQVIESEEEFTAAVCGLSVHDLMKRGLRTMFQTGNRPPRAWQTFETMLSLIDGNEANLASFELALGINILYQALSDCLGKLYDKGRYGGGSGVTSAKLEVTTQSRGWCPAHTHRQRSDIAKRYVISCLDAHDTRSHQRCNARRCQYNSAQILEPRHSERCPGTCNLVVCDDMDLIKILESGGLPGLRRRASWKDGGMYEVCDLRGSPYTAISHVWSHGMANASQNALYQCQLDDVSSAVLHTDPEAHDILFWVDTVCIPHQRKWKLRLIAQMREIYQDASKVLVVDRYLQNVKDSLIDRQYHLVSSEWQTRLWTMQEARLASDPWVMFSSKAVPVQELREPDYNLQHDDFVLFHGFYDDGGVRLLFECKAERLGMWASLIADMPLRTTAFKEDEPICLAVVLNLDVFQAGQKQPAMEDIYQTSFLVHKSLLFVRAPKLLSPGLRWAPSTLLGVEGLPVMPPSRHMDVSAFVVPSGLYSRYLCFVLQQPLTLYFGFPEVIHFVNIGQSKDIMLRVKADENRQINKELVVARPIIILHERIWNPEIPGSLAVLADALDGQQKPFDTHPDLRKLTQEAPEVMTRIKQVLETSHEAQLCRYVASGSLFASSLMPTLPLEERVQKDWMPEAKFGPVVLRATVEADKAICID